MRASSRRSSVMGGLLLTTAMVCTPCNATEAGAGLPEGFLEYLATLVDQEGEWVDALELNDGDTGQTIEPEIDDLASSSTTSSTADDKAEE